MALADTTRAIGAITDAISQRLNTKTGLSITIGRPEPGAAAAANRLNLFLYEVTFDANLKNVALDEGQRPPLWLVLRYLLTAFDDDGKTSDTVGAFQNLGTGIRALQELSVFPLTPGLPLPIVKALGDNPEEIKLTFDDASTDLLSKVMQGTDEKYRVSVAFQVRPIMIAPAETPGYSLLVGVDYSAAPPATIGDAGIHIPVIPSLGPTIDDVSPASFTPGSTVTITGTDLHLANLSVRLGSVTLPVTMQQPDRLQFVAREDLVNGSTISAGNLPTSVGQFLPTGRTRTSNALLGTLRPVVSTTTILAGSLQTVAIAPPPVGWKFATIDLTGKLLGTADDDCFLALFKDGVAVRLFDALTDTSPANAPQTAKRLVMQKPDAVPPGGYLAVYRVNGAQALQSLPVDLR